jgi:pyruvate dehydrogenase E1 component alpha subunit
MDKSDRVAVTFFGEGAMDEGSFYECANYAAIKRLPVLFVCENNLYATESPLCVRQAAGTDLCERVRSFKIEAARIDGNDVLEVFQQTKAALDALRSGKGPYFMECMTYRWREHVGPHFDHELNRNYRSREEVESWMRRCPVIRSGERLIENGIATADQLQSWYNEVQTKVTADVERARQAPWPQVSTLFDHV